MNQDEKYPAPTPATYPMAEALTRIRNRAVHPPKSSGFPNFTFEVLEQAWRFGLYLLERAILAEASYKGRIHQRIRPGR